MFYEPRLGNSGLAIDPLKALVVPRPIGWISSVDLEGRVNLAPFSFFNMVAEDPPIVMFAATGAKSDGAKSDGAKPDGAMKDTPRNVAATGAFVVNLANWDLREQMNASAASMPFGTSEAEAAGLAMAPSTVVVPPRVAASPVALECRHLQSLSLPSLDPAEPNIMLFGEVVGVHVADDLIVDGRVDITKARPIAKLGYALYTVVEKTFAMQRPA